MRLIPKYKVKAKDEAGQAIFRLLSEHKMRLPFSENASASARSFCGPEFVQQRVELRRELKQSGIWRQGK
jgi:hypothetical protein